MFHKSLNFKLISFLKITAIFSFFAHFVIFNHALEVWHGEDYLVEGLFHMHVPLGDGPILPLRPI